MKRVLSFSMLAIACILVCSCKNKSTQAPSPSAPAETPATAHAKTQPGTPTKILEFYKAFCADWDGNTKTDSILSKYCTKELKDVVMESIGEYDFVTNGYCDIDVESFHVVKRNEKYVVYFEFPTFPVSNKPGRDSVYVMVNRADEIAYIIRPSDNYRIPGIYSSKSKLIYYHEHQYVDLGLSVNWATSNIGSRSVDPQWPGQLFAWGDTLAKYNFSKDYYLAPKQDRYYDGKLTVLEPNDDAATVLWGEDWRMPTKEEFQELIDKCSWEWTREDYSYWGYRVTGPNGNSIFLPAGGMIRGNETINREDGLYYWTASCNFNDPEREPRAWQFCSTSDGPDKSRDRSMVIVPVPLSVQSGRSIRPVTTKPFVPIRDIGLNKRNLKLEIGEEFVLTASFFPQDATPGNLYWHSGNSAVAHIDSNGKVTAVSDGKCTITAKCGDFKKECQVTVVRPKDFVPEEPAKITTIYEFGKEVNKNHVADGQDFPDSLELKEVFNTHIGDETDGFSVTIWAFADGIWGGDPGDFCMVTIENASGQYRFRNNDWVLDDLFENNYFLCYPVDNSRYLLLLKGFNYGCCPGLLSILEIDKTGARMVFNETYYLEEINLDPFSLTLENDGTEYVSKYETNYSAAFNLFIEDDALKMKRVKLLRE